mmetsp:Transcript_103395/g.211027  ORF Transcript_103395/g.211027 Transcript_103395/m.211027 type:complete len:122 (-) Transcript_103395:40-405(-)
MMPWGARSARTPKTAEHTASKANSRSSCSRGERDDDPTKTIVSLETDQRTTDRNKTATERNAQTNSRPLRKAIGLVARSVLVSNKHDSQRNADCGTVAIHCQSFDRCLLLWGGSSCVGRVV